MDEPERAALPPPPPEWGRRLPPPAVRRPGIRILDHPRLVPLSPRVAVLIAAAIRHRVMLWMARDAVRPFILGLLLVYLLDPPVRGLAAVGCAGASPIIVVYVIGFLLFLEFLNLTLTPLINEIVRLLQDLPGLATAAPGAGRPPWLEIYDRLALPDAVPPMDRVDGSRRSRRAAAGGGRCSTRPT
jgi:hypothetical protein